jgi:hypothetical protein
MSWKNCLSPPLNSRPSKTTTPETTMKFTAQPTYPAALGMLAVLPMLPWSAETAPACLLLLGSGFLAITTTADWLRHREP